MVNEAVIIFQKVYDLDAIRYDKLKRRYAKSRQAETLLKYYSMACKKYRIKKAIAKSGRKIILNNE